MENYWLVEERVALVPVIGKVVKASLPQADLLEEKIRFGSHFQQVAMCCWPSDPEERKRTAVLFIHGGGWYSGSPLLYRFVGHFFASRGYPTLLGGYRLAPEFHFPVQFDDVRQGLEAGLEALAQEGVSVDQVVVGGQSAGGHLAALLAYAWGLERPSIPLGGFFSISGPVSFADCSQPKLRHMIADMMGEQTNWSAADPIQWIRGDEKVPALLIHGDRDPLVDAANTLAFAEKLSRSGTCKVKTRLVHGGHHADLAGLFVEDLPITRVLIRWLEMRDRIKATATEKI
jgi:acetyl esterase/lipase